MEQVILLAALFLIRTGIEGSNYPADLCPNIPGFICDTSSIKVTGTPPQTTSAPQTTPPPPTTQTTSTTEKVTTYPFNSQVQQLTQNGKDFQFMASPSQLKVGLTEAAAMRCNVRNKRFISTIFVTKDNGEDVASLTPYSGPQGLADSGNLQVKGDIKGQSLGEGYLELTWADPSRMSPGEYACSVAAVDARGHPIVVTETLQLTVVSPSIEDMVSYIKAKEDEKQKQIQLQHDQILLLQNQHLLQQNQITKLKACTQARAAFTAAVYSIFRGSRTFTVANNHPVVFDTVLYQEGLGYDHTTGQFTIDESGVYSFTVNAHSFDKENVCLALLRNSNIIASLNAHDTDTDDTASTSAVLHLKKGDVVRVVATCQSKLKNTPPFDIHPNTFIGLLVKPDSCVV